MTQFGDVRAALARNSYVEQWSHLAWALTHYEGERPITDVESYVRSHLERWPASVERQAPHSWLEAWWAERPTPFLGLANLVNLIGIPWGAALVPRIAAEPAFQDLRSLYLWGAKVGDGDWSRMMSLPWRRLATLDLGACELARPSHVAPSRVWPALERLVLSQNEFGHGVLGWLLVSGDFPALTTLHASVAGLAEKDLYDLGHSKLPETLIEVNLGRNRIQNRWLHLLLERDWGRLETLDLSENPIGDDGLETLARSEFPRLKHLHLTGVQATARGLEALLESDWISGVETLVLTSNRLDDRALTLLEGAVDALASLVDLRLVYNQDVTQAAKARLRAVPWTQRCHVLEL